MSDSGFSEKIHPFRPQPGDRDEGPPNWQHGDPGPSPEPPNGHDAHHADRGAPPIGELRKRALVLLYGDAATEPQPMGTVVDGLLHVGSLTLVYGPPKSGKSFLLTDLLASVAHGCDEWMGHEIVRPGPILYVSCEGHAGFWKRLKAVVIDRQWGKLDKKFVLAIGRPHLIEIGDRLRVVPHPDDVLDALKEMKVKGLMPVAVAIDTVFRSVGAGNVNDSSHMNVYLAAVSTIIDQGIALALVHHETKSGGTPAGSVSLIGGADTVVMTQKNGDSNTWEIEMAKDDAPTKPRSFRLDPVEVGPDKDGRPTTSCIVRDAGPAPKAARGAGRSKAAQLVDDLLETYDRLACDAELSQGHAYEPVRKVSLKAIQNDLRRRDRWAAHEGAATHAENEAFRKAKRALDKTLTRSTAWFGGPRTRVNEQPKLRAHHHQS